MGFAAAFAAPNGNVWHMTESVENDFDWNEDGVVSYTNGSSVDIKEVELKDPWG